MKERCSKCKKNKAVWIYMPASVVYCDECVLRGCICQMEVQEDLAFENLDTYNNFIMTLRDGTNPMVNKHYKDDKDRLLPCVEYEYDIDGFEVGSDGVDVLNKIFNIYNS